MKSINVHEAKTTLSALLVAVEQGEEVIIARNGVPAARLTRLAPAPVRSRGAWRSLPGWQDFRYDAALFAPLGDDEMDAEGWL